MICRGAFDKQGVRGKPHGDLRMWAINDRSINGTAENTFKIVKANHVMDELYEEFADMNMAEIMQDQTDQSELNQNAIQTWVTARLTANTWRYSMLPNEQYLRISLYMNWTMYADQRECRNDSHI